MIREFDAGGYVLSCIYSPDGERLAAAARGGAGRVRVWCVASGALLYQLGDLCASGIQRPLAFSPDNKTLLTSQGDDCATLQLFCMETGALLVDEGDCGHDGAITAVAFSPVRHADGGPACACRGWLAACSHRRPPPPSPPVVFRPGRPRVADLVLRRDGADFVRSLDPGASSRAFAKRKNAWGAGTL